MNIIELRCENFKRLKAVHVETKGGKLITISGRNNQGKSSLIDAIAAAIGGLDHVPRVPVRAGQDHAEIYIDLGELRITRRINPDRTSILIVENRDGTRIKSPQQVLDKMAAELTLDPMQFMSLRAVDRINELKRLVPEFDFKQNAKARQDAYERRTEVGRDYRRHKANIDTLPPQPETRPRPIDVAKVLAEMQAADDHNRRINLARENHEAEDAALVDLEAEIKYLRESLRKKTAELLALQERIDGREEIPNAINTDAMKLEIARAQSIDHEIRQFDDCAQHKRELDLAQVEIRRLDGLIEDLDDARNLAIRNAKLPVEGLSFGEDDVLIDSLPFAQASSSTQLAVATGISMALRPTLKIILLRQGPLLDVEHLELLAKIASDRDYQLWVERIDPDAKTGIVIEDGEIV